MSCHLRRHTQSGHSIQAISTEPCLASFLGFIGLAFDINTVIATISTQTFTANVNEQLFQQTWCLRPCSNIDGANRSHNQRHTLALLHAPHYQTAMTNLPKRNPWLLLDPSFLKRVYTQRVSNLFLQGAVERGCTYRVLEASSSIWLRRRTRLSAAAAQGHPETHM